jgi:hypothetical protein
MKGGQIAMSKEEALYQSLASCGATLIAFMGVCHEFVGQILFPWGPALFGGALGWHAGGFLTISIGLLMLGGTLRIIAFPVVPPAVLMTAIGIAVAVFAVVVHHEFHMFALAMAASGAITAFCHRKAIAQPSLPPDGPFAALRGRAFMGRQTLFTQKCAASK